MTFRFGRKANLIRNELVYEAQAPDGSTLRYSTFQYVGPTGWMLIQKRQSDEARWRVVTVRAAKEDFQGPAGTKSAWVPCSLMQGNER
jgi:hypothetical protein